jgi:hypothetical protein
MNPPPFLLLAALLFWGWESGFLMVGLILGLILESDRLLKLRWDFEDQDFRRIWGFCTLLAIALAGYVYMTNEAGGVANHGGNATATRNATISTVQAATTVLRWLPITLFLFVAGQKFSVRGQVPLSRISTIPMRWRRQEKTEPERYVNISYHYFMVCLFSAGIHLNDGSQSYFWGLAVLTAWALWSLRPPRFSLAVVAVWLAALLAAGGLGFLGQAGIGRAQTMIENYNAQWLARFFRPRTDAAQSVTSLGQIGNLKLSARIVIRLQPKNSRLAPDYLREASYRNYQALKQTWFAPGARNDFDSVLAEVGGLTWILLPGKTNASAATIACYLDGWSKDLGAPEGLLPLPLGSGRLENLPTLTLKKNSAGAVLATGPGLVIFDALYGPGTAIDSPPDAGTNRSDFMVPTNEIPALDQVISEMNLTATNTAEIFQTVANFFQRKFTYSTWQNMDKKATAEATPLTRFLLTSRSGHCEYFATATVLLLRRLHIPARYATGYYVHEASGIGYVVRERDAHAWCLAWDDAAKTWENFDTTPSSWVETEGGRASFWDWFSDARSWLGFQFAKFRWGQTHLSQYVLWALAPAMAVLLYYILFRRDRKQARREPKTKIETPIYRPGLDSEFYQLEKKLAARLPRQPGESLSNWLDRALAEPELAELRAPAQSLLPLHYRLRFDPAGLADEERNILAQKVRVVLEMLSEK